MAQSYRCSEFPGMESCPGMVVAQTEDELWQLIGLHAKVAHGEDMAGWSAEDRAQVEALIRTAD